MGLVVMVLDRCLPSRSSHAHMLSHMITHPLGVFAKEHGKEQASAADAMGR